MLRARAYGPSADILDDPAALERLSELEFFADASSAEPAEAQSSLADPGVAEEESAVTADATPDDGSPAEVGAATPRPRNRRRRALVGLAVLAAVVVATAAITSFVVRKVEADPLTIATLTENPAVELPNFGGPSNEGGATGFTDFFGVTPAVVEGGAYGLADGDCLTLLDTAEIDPGASSWSSLGGGCSAGPFSATVQFIVTNDANVPTELRERFPEGTALKFVLQDSSIVVLSDRG